ELKSAKQELSAEMRQLLTNYKRPKEDAVIGGIPVDSEYIVFVIDTSGSMQRFAWPLVRKKMKEILDIYPRVKGVQVLNDMGDYMFSQYAGRWIPDSSARRRAILDRLSTWAPFSNSSPVEGITKAIQRFYASDKRISLYVFGDDFSGGLMQNVVDTVRRKNSAGSRNSRVRIHTIGFPVLLAQPGAGQNAARFAALMRRLAEDNNGSFVGLSSLR
ncbi:MAG: VWA domain-containing protein, partial [Deltaproteobacteria bacterium]